MWWVNHSRAHLSDKQTSKITTLNSCVPTVDRAYNTISPPKTESERNG